MNVLKTPEHRFLNLKDYPFKANYMDVGGLQMHYLDEGEKTNKVIFLFHGQPSWSYLYRHMIPLLVKQGYRVIAPDLIGFGKSDKPSKKKDHTYTAHVTWMSTFVKKLGINHAAAFMQDWGGMIGLRVLANNPDWLDRLIVANTALSEFKGFQRWLTPKVMTVIRSTSGKASLTDLNEKMNYSNWAGYFTHSDVLEIGQIMQLLTTKNMTPEEMKAYDAPFPNDKYYAGPRTMPEIVVTDLKEAYDDWQKLKRWNHPVLTLFSDKDPFLADKGYDTVFQDNFSGAKGQPHITVTNASHFLQEDQSTLLSSKISNWLQQTSF